MSLRNRNRMTTRRIHLLMRLKKKPRRRGGTGRLHLDSALLSNSGRLTRDLPVRVVLLTRGVTRGDTKEGMVTVSRLTAVDGGKDGSEAVIMAEAVEATEAEATEAEVVTEVTAVGVIMAVIMAVITAVIVINFTRAINYKRVTL